MHTLTERAAPLLAEPGDLGDAQVALHLLRSCAGVCRVSHLLRTLPCDAAGVDQALVDYDQQVRSTLANIVGGTSVPEDSWTQAAAPCRQGGLGLRSAAVEWGPLLHSACRQVRPLVRQLTGHMAGWRPVLHARCAPWRDG